MLVLANLARNWWVFALRGIIAILFGVLAFIRPGITLEVLVLLFAFWALFDGVLALIGSVGAAEAHEPWWPLVLTGLLSVAAGLVALRWPGITALALLLVVAYWSILRGILEIAAAVRLRHLVQGELWFILGGIASIAFGALLALNPGPGLMALLWLVGIYSVFFGIMLLMFGFRIRNLVGMKPTPTAARARSS